MATANEYKEIFRLINKRPIQTYADFIDDVCNNYPEYGWVLSDIEMCTQIEMYIRSRSGDATQINIVKKLDALNEILNGIGAMINEGKCAADMSTTLRYGEFES